MSYFEPNPPQPIRKVLQCNYCNNAARICMCSACQHSINLELTESIRWKSIEYDSFPSDDCSCLVVNVEYGLGQHQAVYDASRCLFIPTSQSLLSFPLAITHWFEIPDLPSRSEDDD